MIISEELAGRILRFVSEVTAAMGLSLEADVERTADGIRIDLEGSDGELLIRRRGEALEALRHIVSAAFRDRLPGGGRIALDCQGFRKDRDGELRQMAHFLAERASSSGLEQVLGPLNPYERRIVHLALCEEPAIKTFSEGDEGARRVVVAPREPGERGAAGPR